MKPLIAVEGDVMVLGTLLLILEFPISQFLFVTRVMRYLDSFKSLH